MREVTACFSGHRPEKLPDRGNSNSQITKVIKSLIKQEIDIALADGYTDFIVGMARGIDLWAGEILTDMICIGVPLKTIAVYPYRGYNSRLRGMELWASGRILGKASEIIYLNDEYYRGCMRERNRYMIDRSSRLIAVVSDFRSGTGQTISYAKKENVDVRVISLNKLFPPDDEQTSLL